MCRRQADGSGPEEQIAGAIYYLADWGRDGGRMEETAAVIERVQRILETERNSFDAGPAIARVLLPYEPNTGGVFFADAARDLLVSFFTDADKRTEMDTGGRSLQPLRTGRQRRMS